MVASLRPPSLRRPSEGEVKSSQVADSREEEKRHHHAMPKDGERDGGTEGRAWMARAGRRAKSCHAEGVVGRRRGEGRPPRRADGRADGEGEIARISQIMLTGGVIRDHTEEIPQSGRERYWFEGAV